MLAARAAVAVKLAFIVRNVAYLALEASSVASRAGAWLARFAGFPIPAVVGFVAEDASRGPTHVLEGHALADLVERGAVGLVERIRAHPPHIERESRFFRTRRVT